MHHRSLQPHRKPASPKNSRASVGPDPIGLGEEHGRRGAEGRIWSWDAGDAGDARRGIWTVMGMVLG